jgi:hypothetical protein
MSNYLECSTMINGFIQCWFARLSMLQNIHSDVLNQNTSLVVHIRDVINKFVQGEIVNKEKLSGTLPE